VSLPPALSVVIAASDSGPAARRAVLSVREQAIQIDVEIVVAGAADRIEDESSSGAATWISAPPGTAVPRLRRLGWERASAPVVVFTEDSCLFSAGWLAAWLDAFEDPDTGAATGPVEPAMGRSPVDWAVFFCEYAPFLAENLARATAPTRLAGNNFAVRSGRCPAVDRAEIHEGEVASETRGRLAYVAGAAARHVRRYSLSEAVADRWRFGLAFGRLRARRSPRSVRALALGASPAILAVQLVRVARVVAQTRRHAGRFVVSLPIVLVCLFAWSLGESIGWSLGSRDRSAARRRRGTGARRRGRAPAPPALSRDRCTPAPRRA
jgi:hypothetical protein